MIPPPPSGDSTAARRYARSRYRLLLVEFAASIGLLALLQGSGVSRAVAAWWSQRVASPSLAVLGYLVWFGVVYELALLPLRFYGGFLVEHRFGLSRLKIRGWIVREAKRLGVNAVVGIILVEGLYALLRHAPAHWPVWAALGWVAFSVLLARIFPIVILPLFYPTAPLKDDVLVNRLLALCRRAGLCALGVFRVRLGTETRKANAALAGFGKTRRVLLSDTLLEQFTPDEVEGVLAHELAHHRYRHFAKMLVMSAAGAWVAFTLTDAVGQRWVGWLGLDGFSDIAGFPALMLWLTWIGLISRPLQNGLSRRFEWQADRFAVKTVTRPQAFADALRRLAQINLADPQPPRWVVWFFYDHPPITQRIRAAEHADG